LNKFGDDMYFGFCGSGSPLRSENSFWMLARMSNPCLIDNRFAGAEIVKRPTSPVQFVTTCSETCSLEDFVGVAISLCTLNQKREHQFLGFDKA
jgi:hypothetical protein